ncbi:MAG: hypothetical protein KC933_16735 [Myxococcales bacterium]|nr:hypothetical protein [Myxococcales bacterium]
MSVGLLKWACAAAALLGSVAAQAETATVAVSRDALAKLAEEQARLRAQLEALQEAQDALLDPEGLALAEDVEGPTLRFYGFLETGTQRTFAKNDAFLYGIQQTPGWTFLLANAHLYVDVTPGPRWRALMELRLVTQSGLYGIGAGGVALVSSQQRAFNEPGVGVGGYILTSALVVERAQVEWSANDAFGLRLGLWLTPWGIWNVDHGSPTLIALVQPYFQAFQMFPTHQVGIAAFGTFHWLPWSLRYHLAISNGRITGPAQLASANWGTYDLDDDKMVSGRVSLHRSGASNFSAGLSAYYGDSEIPGRIVESIDPVQLDYQAQLTLREWGVGADVSVDIDQLRLRAEASYTQYRFPEQRPFLPRNATLLHPDSAQWGAYFLASYWTTLGTFRVEPYATLDLVWWPVALSPLELGVLPSAGVNIDLAASVRLKLQYGYQMYFDVTDGKPVRSAVDDVHHLSGRLVVSF